MATWRVHVTCTDAEAAEEFKKEFYKKLYQSAGPTVSFEVPEMDEAGADEIIKAAKDAGFEASKEKYEDPLDSAQGTVDFW